MENKQARQLGPTRGILLWSSVAQSLGQEQATESNCQSKMQAFSLLPSSLICHLKCHSGKRCAAELSGALWSPSGQGSAGVKLHSLAQARAAKKKP